MRRAAEVTPAPSEKRKVARGALLCSQGQGLDGDVSIADAGNPTPDLFPRGKGNNRGSQLDGRGVLAVAELGVVEYDDALAMQIEMLAARIEGKIGDTLLMMEHPHVFTLGRAADERFIVANKEGVPIRRVSRGG